MAVAERIHKLFGGNLVLRSEDTEEGEYNPDYLWNDKLWDLKTTTTEKSANSALRHGLQQIASNPGGIILNFEDRKIVYEELLDVIEKRMHWNRLKRVDILILLQDEYRVLRYIKN